MQARNITKNQATLLSKSEHARKSELGHMLVIFYYSLCQAVVEPADGVDMVYLRSVICDGGKKGGRDTKNLLLFITFDCLSKMAPSMPNFSNFHPQQLRDAWQPQGTSTAMLASWALSCLLALIIPVAKWATERNSYYAYQG
eukprot:scaffold9381_cov73-Skeletonema_marinoi.AAC.1